jgi:hypothetical protein
MKITKTASGKNQLKLSRSEWEAIGKKAGWTTSKSGPLKKAIRTPIGERPSSILDNVWNQFTSAGREFQSVLKGEQDLQEAISFMDNAIASSEVFGEDAKTKFNFIWRPYRERLEGKFGEEGRNALSLVWGSLKADIKSVIDEYK